MNKLLKSLLLAFGMSTFLIGAAHANAEPKKASMSASASAKTPVPASASAAATPPTPAEKAALIDINSATKKELSELPKIGDAQMPSLKVVRIAEKMN